MAANAVADPDGSGLITPPPTADTPRGNPFINFLVKWPCSCATITMVLCIITVIGTMTVISQKGTDIFGDGAKWDISDIRSREWEAYNKAIDDAKLFSQSGSACIIKRWGVSRPCDTQVYAQQTQDADVVMTMFVAKSGDQLFTASNIAQMRIVEDKILTHKNYSDFCKRGDPLGIDTSCDQPISPLNLFYANNVNIATLVADIDGLDQNRDGNPTVLQTPGLSAELSRIQGAYQASVRNIMMGQQNSSCMQASASVGTMNLDHSVMSCIFQQVVGTMSPQPNSTSVTVAKKMFPLVHSLGNPRGSIMQDVPATLQLAAYMKQVSFYAPYVDYYFDKGFSLAKPTSKYSRGMIRFGQPLVGYRNRDDRNDDQDKKFRTWFRDEFNQYLKETKDVGDVEVLFFATPLIRDEFISIILMDMLKVLVSLTFVFLWIWMQTQSVIIAIAGIIEILLSLPLAFFFYYTVFGFKYFDSLNAMTIFIVCAIGADDIFVFMDQYKQSAYLREVCVDLKTRMNWVYSRAAWAMFITSATTCAAFICTAASPLPSIQSFGVFSAFVIAADYILVITWFPACLVMYHNYMEKRPCCCCCCWCKDMFPCKFDMETTTSLAYLRKEDEEPKKRSMERCISGPFAGWLGRLSPFVVIGFLLLMIPFGILAANIQPLSRAEESLPADHPFQRIWTLSNEEFPNSAQNTNSRVYVVWGVTGLNMDKVNILRDGGVDAGVLEWDTSFRFDKAAQQHIWNVCEEVRKMEPASLELFLSRDKESSSSEGEVDCVLQDWKTFLEQHPARPGFPLSLAQVPTYMELFLASSKVSQRGLNQTMKQKWRDHLGYDPRVGRVRLIVVTVRTQLVSRASHTSQRLTEHYNMFDAWVKEINSPVGRLPAPPSASNAFQTSDGAFNGPNWIWMHTQSIFRTSAIQGSSVGTVVAFVVILFATQQIIIALASFVTIACILASVLAMMKLADYELGTITSICITILAGFAVDYVVHLAHAYNHSKKPTRGEKYQEAFDVIGVSVLSGMVTSVLAAAVLLLCSLQFFAKFGFFLIFTVLLAWVWGNCFFMCLMKLVGPDNNTPWLLQVPYSILPSACKASKGTSDKPQTPQTK